LHSFSFSSCSILLLLFSGFKGSKGGNLEVKGRAPEVNVNVSEVKGIVPEVLDVKQGSKGKNTGSKE